MNVLVTGSTGRVGRAIYIHLMSRHQVYGLDQAPSSTTDYLGNISDTGLLRTALNPDARGNLGRHKVDVIVHSAALHAPHVGLHSEELFHQVNIAATEQLFKTGAEYGVKHFVFTSTTALYGHASTPVGRAGWIDEHTTPQPKTIYHHTKLAAEVMLERLSQDYGVPVTILRMSRCFPEAVDIMAVYRLNRGVDVRDVATAHGLAIEKRLTGVRRFIVSATTPFQPEDCDGLYHDAASCLRQRAPALCEAFDQRGWPLPRRLDRVYDNSAARQQLGWQPRHGFESVLRMLDEAIPEVLPITRQHRAALQISE